MYNHRMNSSSPGFGLKNLDARLSAIERNVNIKDEAFEPSFISELHRKEDDVKKKTSVQYSTIQSIQSTKR